MPASKETVLLDNCAISACRDAGGWNALAARYNLETVEEVESEAGTGFHHREIIDPRTFRRDVVSHKVDLAARLDALDDHPNLGTIDAGERDLWIHALARHDAWMLCGPDIASIQFGVNAGHKDRLVSLEKLFQIIGFKPKVRLKECQTEKWLQGIISTEVQRLTFAKIDQQRQR